jgi:hypothetical protein
MKLRLHSSFEMFSRRFSIIITVPITLGSPALEADQDRILLKNFLLENHQQPNGFEIEHR